MTSEFDIIILGQGLAGTALAWWLQWAGKTSLVIDREAPSTSSKIAAGLITPITGQKLVRAWRDTVLWPAATSFYDRAERESSSRFFRQLAMVRLLNGPDEAARWKNRVLTNEFAGMIRQPDPLVNQQWFDSVDGGFEMSPGGQLDVPEYLRASREYFRLASGYVSSHIDVSRDIELVDGGIRIPHLGVKSQHIIFCQGIDAIENPWFRDVRFKPAKGEILTVRIPGLEEHRVIHRGVWLAPLGSELFKAGSTYNWKELDCLPTEKGRAEIVSRLREFLRLPFDVVSHEAAIRPIHRNQHPVLGIHPAFPQLGFFNGLGSKGALQAPYFAHQLSNWLTDGTPVDSEVDLNRKTNWRSLELEAPNVGDRCSEFVKDAKRQMNRPLTELAQAAIRQTLNPGEFAIDATAGNGHDTCFLADVVGPSGTVYAFDIQKVALKQTAKRLADSDRKNVILLNRDHGQLAESIPQNQHGQIAAVMFNLGYLPGGDKSLTTNSESTRLGISQATDVLRLGGTITIVAYTGHDGGAAEAAMVAKLLEGLSRSEFQVETIESQAGKQSGPRMFLVKRVAIK